MKIPNIKSQANAGFSLIELLVVVAIVGLLTKIAVQDYLQYSEIARQAEVKTSLASSFVGEMITAVNSGSFSYCLADIAAAPAGTSNYYTYGFFTPNLTNFLCAATGNRSCIQAKWDLTTPVGAIDPALACTAGNHTNFAANLAASGGVPCATPTCVNPDGTNVCNFITNSTFVIGGCGQISSTNAAVLDMWQIDQKKAITHTLIGL